MPLDVDFYGKATLGEFYADAVLDMYGEAEAKKHLTELGTNENAKLKPQAVKKIKLVAKKINTKFQNDLAKFHSFSYLYPKDFYTNENASLLGYSERLFYVETQKKRV